MKKYFSLVLALCCCSCGQMGTKEKPKAAEKPAAAAHKESEQKKPAGDEHKKMDHEMHSDQAKEMPAGEEKKCSSPSCSAE